LRTAKLLVVAAAVIGMAVTGSVPAQAWAPVPGTVQQEYVHSIKDNHPYYAERLDNGNFLFGQVGYDDPAVVEVDARGSEVWRHDGVQPASAVRLDNGNTLIADSGTPGFPFMPRVLEVDRQGQKVWEYQFNSMAQSPRYVQRLDNGNTLITLPFQVIEVTPGKKVTWSYGSDHPLNPGDKDFLAYPMQAVRLGNGNTLVVDRGFGTGRVLEVSPAKNIVWQYGEIDSTGWPFGKPKVEDKEQEEGLTESEPLLAGPTAAKRLDDGSTLITDLDAQRTLMVAAKGDLMEERSWADIIEPWPVWNNWYAAAGIDGSLLLTTTLSSYNSRVLVLDTGAKQKAKDI